MPTKKRDSTSALVQNVTTTTNNTQDRREELTGCSPYSWAAVSSASPRISPGTPGSVFLLQTPLRGKGSASTGEPRVLSDPAVTSWSSSSWLVATVGTPRASSRAEHDPSMEQEIVLISFALSPAGMMVTLLLACVGASTTSPSPSPPLAGKGSEGWLRLFRLSGCRPSTGGAPFEADKDKEHLSTAEEVAPRVW